MTTSCKNKLSNAGVEDIIFYDSSADQRAENLYHGKRNQFGWDKYLEVAGDVVLEMLQYGWFLTAYGNIKPLSTSYNNKLISNFDPTKLRHDSRILIQLHVFKALELFYGSLITDQSNVNEVDVTNHAYNLKRFEETYKLAMQLSNFYDFNSDGVIDMTEENEPDKAYFTNDRRYF
jgi:hypothetical protein